MRTTPPRHDDASTSAPDVDAPSSIRPYLQVDPARIGAGLRRRIAQHDRMRRDRQLLIIELSAYVARLKIQNMLAAQVVGRLRRMAAGYDFDAACLARQRRFAALDRIRMTMRVAA